MCVYLVGYQRDGPVLEVLCRAVAIVVHHAAVHIGLDRWEALDSAAKSRHSSPCIDLTSPVHVHQNVPDKFKFDFFIARENDSKGSRELGIAKALTGMEACAPSFTATCFFLCPAN